MSSASDIETEGPFVDRNAVIVPVSPGRDLALGDVVAADGLLRLAHGAGNEITFAPSAATPTSRWALWTYAGMFWPPAGATDEVFNLGWNSAAPGALVDPNEPQFGMQLESNYELTAGGVRVSEFLTYYNSPTGVSLRPFGWAVTREDGAGVPNLAEIALRGKVQCFGNTGGQWFGSSDDGASLWFFAHTNILLAHNNKAALSQHNATATAYLELARIDNYNRVLLGANGVYKVATYGQLMLCAGNGSQRLAGRNTDLAINQNQPQCWSIEAVADITCTLNVPPSVADAGTFWFVQNDGTHTITVRHSGGGTPIIGYVRAKSWAMFMCDPWAYYRIAWGSLVVEHESYTVAQLNAGTPSPAPAGRQVYCSDHTGGARMAYSDGAAWRDMRTGNVVA